MNTSGNSELNALLNSLKSSGVLDKPQEKSAVKVDLSICTEEEKPRMIALINRLAKSEAGRETLEIAAEAGYKFGFLEESANCKGCCFGGHKYIGLKPSVPDDMLVAVLCHECRHAGQNDRMGSAVDRSLLNVASIVRSNFAMEADANAYALKACKELEASGEAAPYSSFAADHPEVCAAAEKALVEEGTMNDKVVAAAFKGWYDQTDVKQRYEERYIIEPMHKAIEQMKAGKIPANLFMNDLSSEAVVSKIGWTQDGNYLAAEDPKFLDEPRFLSIGERTKTDALAYFEIRETKTGCKKDVSVENMPVHKDAFPRKLPEIGRTFEADKRNVNEMFPTLRRWRSILNSR